MYKAAVRWMIRRNIAKLNAGDHRPALAMYADDAVFSFPGQNSWAEQFHPLARGRRYHPTHRGKDEIAQFMQRFTGAELRLEIEDILVNGPPWNTRSAVVANVWSPGDGGDRYTNRAVLYVTGRWGKLRTHEDFEDTEAVAAFDRLLTDS